MLVHKGCVCCLGFCLSAEGRLQLPAHCQRLYLVDCENGAQGGRCGGLRRPLAFRGWPPVAAGHPGGISTSPSSP